MSRHVQGVRPTGHLHPPGGVLPPRCWAPYVTGPALRAVLGGQQRALYGAITGRYWLGEAGRSALVACSAYVEEPVCAKQWPDLLEGTRQAMVAQLTQEAHAAYGLDLHASIATGLQLQVELQAWPSPLYGRANLSDRVGSFEAGYATEAWPGIPRIKVGDGDIKRIVERYKAITTGPARAWKEQGATR